ncbi:MAG: hypothetical protein QME46_02380 [Thermoanaerobacteraceae bacterium]|nr:hypothetical protein [Thermoanaerobacteraceae bacterium]
MKKEKSPNTASIIANPASFAWEDQEYGRLFKYTEIALGKELKGDEEIPLVVEKKINF